MDMELEVSGGGESRLSVCWVQVMMQVLGVSHSGPWFGSWVVSQLPPRESARLDRGGEWNACHAGYMCGLV